MASQSESPLATVLVVDDNAQNRALTASLLDHEGYGVVSAASGEEGLETFQREAPDCVIMDVRLPGMDGFAACERIRALPGGAETPVIFLTALREVETFDSALRAGGDDFLTRPVRPTELLLRVQYALKLRRLGAEVRSHYGVLKHQRDALVRLQLQKERLMAFVVHDLKNPVYAIDLHAQVLTRDASLSETSRASATQIRLAARRLDRMLHNLLDVRRSDEGELVLKRRAVDLRAVVSRVVDEMEITARELGVELKVELAQAEAQADQDLLERMLMNLVENGVRHAPKGTTVRVTVARVGAETEIRVADSGRPIPEAERAGLFNPFVQLEEAEGPSSRAGRGLGLAFSRVVAEAHGGRIWVEDGNPGAVIALTIPDAV